MLRIGFFGQSGPYAPVALRYLIEHSGEVEVALVVEGLRRSPVGRVHRLRKPKRGPLPSGDDLGALALAAGIAVLSTRDINGQGAVRILQEADLDLIVCVGFDRLFGAAVLASARLGGVNAHPSALPRWRGPAPIFWALKAGQRHSAVTLHALDLLEDHGPIYAQRQFVWPHRIGGAEIYRHAAGLVGPMLSRLFVAASNGALCGVAQDHSRASRARRPKPEDALVDPALWKSEALVDFACGAPFFRAAWMRLGDETFHVRRGLRADLGSHIPAHYALSGSTLLVQCLDGVAHLQIQTLGD